MAHVVGVVDDVVIIVFVVLRAVPPAQRAELHAAEECLLDFVSLMLGDVFFRELSSIVFNFLHFVIQSVEYLLQESPQI